MGISNSKSHITKNKDKIIDKVIYVQKGPWVHYYIIYKTRPIENKNNVI